MVRAQCPVSLRKYGFCGLLATVYAARLPMPTSVASLQALLQEVKQILSLGKGKWQHTSPKHTGGISMPDTLTLLKHYKTCDYHATCHEAGPTLRKWLKGVEAKTCYIVHLKTHALFVEVGSVKSKWRAYDQGGVYTKDKTGAMERRYGGNKVRGVVKIMYT
jgi:hypothetical protein